MKATQYYVADKSTTSVATTQIMACQSISSSLLVNYWVQSGLPDIFHCLWPKSYQKWSKWLFF